MLTIKHLTTVIMISLFLVGVNLFIVSTNNFNINDWYYKKVLILPVFLALLLSAACSKDTSLEQKGSAEKAVTRLPITTPEVKEHPEYSSSLYKLDISSGAVSLLADNALRPVVAPDGKKVAVFAVDKPEKHVRISSIKILGLDGTVLHSIHVNEIEMSFFQHKIIWDSPSNSIIAIAYKDKDGSRLKYLVKWDLVTEKRIIKEIDWSVSPLYMEDGKVVCIGAKIP